MEERISEFTKIDEVGSETDGLQGDEPDSSDGYRPSQQNQDKVGLELLNGFITPLTSSNIVNTQDCDDKACQGKKVSTP